MASKRALKLLWTAANAGNPDAQYELGDRYRRGDGTLSDFAAAREWMERAAAQGHAAAQNDLGSLVLNGIGGPADASTASLWYTRSAEQGHPDAQFNLALRYLHGDGVAEDAEAAAEWLWRAMQQHHVEATSQLGTLFRFGRGVKQSYKVAGYLHMQAGKAGDVVAYGNLADYHHEVAALALTGDVQSVLVMAEINAAGIGVDCNPVEALAWVLVAGTARIPSERDDGNERHALKCLGKRLMDGLGAKERAAAEQRRLAMLGVQ